MDTPSDKSDKKPANKTHGLSRQKIIEMALAQLRKKRAETDPKILNIIRDKILSSPALMTKLGLEAEHTQKPVIEKTPSLKQGEVLKELGTKETVSEDQERLLSHVKHIVKAQKSSKANVKPLHKPQHEKVDKKKTLEMISKLMKIKPDLKN